MERQMAAVRVARNVSEGHGPRRYVPRKPNAATVTTAALLLAACLPGIARAQTPRSLRVGAKRAQQAVVTIRTSKSRDSRPVVSLCTGVIVAPNLIVTSSVITGGAAPKVTFPGGQQSQAKVRVVDEYSGLALLQVDGKRSPLTLAEAEPEVGAWVLGAAGWGAERPVVSFGIVSGRRRMVAGAAFPPLLQCDLRAAATSAGGALLDAEGRLLGVIVAIDAEKNKPGWTYAVPVEHVRRLLRENAARDKKPMPRNDTVLILKRRRPVVGMMLDQQDAEIVVRRVTANSPAARAGLKVGDRILAADGIQIRSVYQAVRPLMFKQPGDRMDYRVRRSGKTLEMRVVLGGGLDAPRLARGRDLAQPKIDLERVGRGSFRARSGLGGVRELVTSEGGKRSESKPATAEEKIRLLEKALQLYRNALAAQQQEIRRLEKKVRQLEKK